MGFLYPFIKFHIQTEASGVMFFEKHFFFGQFFRNIKGETILVLIDTIYSQTERVLIQY